MSGLVVAFCGHVLDARGTGRSIFDYADLNESMLGNRSLILVNDAMDNRAGTVDRLARRFPDGICHYRDPREIDGIIRARAVDVFFCVKSGDPDDYHRHVHACRTANHGVFGGQAHGDRFAWVSPWLAEKYGGECVPPIVRRPNPRLGDLRAELGIPAGEFVVGRHGGWPEFDLPQAQEAVRKLARGGMRFVFLSTEPFSAEPTVAFLPVTDDLSRVDQFVYTCDVMLHGRRRGETFGMSCAQFNAANRRVLAWGPAAERGHFHVFGEGIVPYLGVDDLCMQLELMRDFPHMRRARDVVTDRFSAEEVMAKFKRVFLD